MRKNNGRNSFTEAKKIENDFSKRDHNEKSDFDFVQHFNDDVNCVCLVTSKRPLSHFSYLHSYSSSQLRHFQCPFE